MIGRRQFTMGGLAATAVLLVARPGSFALAQPLHPETTKVVQRARASEVGAYREYAAFTRRAKADGYPGIAYLFTALATAELIHGQNFEKILARLGVEVTPIDEGQVQVESTRQNLIKAADDELYCVNTLYPAILTELKPEGFQDAITFTTYAWESEKQHLDILKQIQEWTPDHFEAVASKIEDETAHYYVCQICGSTEIEIPEDNCPICKFPSTNYRKIEPPV